MRSVVLVIIVVVLLVGVFVLLTSKGKHSIQKIQDTVQSTEFLSPFRELTIPYLRSQTYSSRLGAKEISQLEESYTSYLTSYISSGLKINGLLTVPTGQVPKGGWPAIIFIHGYIPPAEYATAERYGDYVDYLARNGFVVFKIDLRGHGQSQGKAGGGYFGSDYVVDTLNAYSALEHADFVNRKAIGLWGHSMAGNIVLRTMAVKPSIPAAVIWAGAVYSYTDQVKYGLHDTSYHPPDFSARQNNSRRELFEKYGSPSATSIFWRQVAPTNYLNDLKGAIEIHHAEDDTVVNIGYSQDLIALLDKTKVPHEFYTYSTGGHNISEPSFSLAMQRTVEFFKKYIKD